MKPSLAINHNDAPALVGLHIHGQNAFEDGAPVIAVPPAEQETRADQFEDALLDAGFNFAQAETAARIFTDFQDDSNAVDGLLVIRELLAKIAGTKTGRSPEFRAILYLLSPGQTLDAISADAGLSRQAVHYHVEKLRGIFTRPLGVKGGDPLNKIRS